VGTTAFTHKLIFYQGPARGNPQSRKLSLPSVHNRQGQDLWPRDENDQKARTKLERKDTPVYRRIIQTARRWIYELGDAVKSARVERLQSPESLVPTLVSLQVGHMQKLLNLDDCRTPFWSASPNLDIIFIKCSFPTSSTRWSSGFSNRFFPSHSDAHRES
jgi:hypothetical protein